jgi:hypothetical protein
LMDIPAPSRALPASSIPSLFGINNAVFMWDPS